MPLCKGLNYYAHYDPLTKLVNRRYFFDLFDQALIEHEQSNHPFNLCICDLDHFKGINDSLGHQAGDLVLTKFAEILTENLGEQDIVGRFGGDEFIVCFHHKTQEECEFLLERVRSTLEKSRFDLDDNANFSVTATFGLAHLRSEQISQSDTNALFEAADKALYQAKQKGRNQISTLNTL